MVKTRRGVGFLRSVVSLGTRLCLWTLDHGREGTSLESVGQSTWFGVEGVDISSSCYPIVNVWDISKTIRGRSVPYSSHVTLLEVLRSITITIKTSISHR